MLIGGAGCAGCYRSQPNTGLPTAPMKLGNQTFTLEIAKTDATRQRGLMKRDSMPADSGMIFVFEKEHSGGFWMKNTRIPLDIIFVDAGGTVLAVKQMKPYDLKSTTSPKPYKWAIELNKGAAESAGVKVGDQVTIADAARETKE
jgi:uncharacterized membrane protein (UPF0127 family)